jgi:riboflavin kinase/FMN adenylyltransferase
VNIVRKANNLPPEVRRGAIAIGNFDGVHRGHAFIIARLIEQAREVAGPAVVLTFEPHPARLLRPDAVPPPLTWVERKAELLAELGVDRVIALPTTLQLLSLSARDFFDQVIVGELDARAIVEGPNFYFGHNREGTIDVLQKLSAEAGISLNVVEPVGTQGQMVSSSRIRQLIAAGEVESANKMLTAPYRIRGLVTHGAGRGRSIGFPTANLDAIDTLLPGHGVYAGETRFRESQWPAAINIGPNPTFDEHSTKVEVHLVGCQQALYGEVLEVDLLGRIRDIRTFGSGDELRQQIDADIEATVRWSASHNIF